MWLVSTFEKIYLKKIFFVSTFLDWYNFAKKFRGVAETAPFFLLKKNLTDNNFCVINNNKLSAMYLSFGLFQI